MKMQQIILFIIFMLLLFSVIAQIVLSIELQRRNKHSRKLKRYRVVYHFEDMNNKNTQLEQELCVGFLECINAFDSQDLLRRLRKKYGKQVVLDDYELRR